MLKIDWLDKNNFIDIPALEEIDAVNSMIVCNTITTSSVETCGCIEELAPFKVSSLLHGPKLIWCINLMDYHARAGFSTCLHTCIHINTCMNTWKCTYTYSHTCIYTYIYKYMHTHVQIYTYSYICTYTQIHRCIHTYTHTQMHAYTHT